MEDEIEKMEGTEQFTREEIFSRAVRAGKRTYFFDVKATRKNEYYLTITESKKKLNKEGRQFYEKHKIFLYAEDFEKFAQGLSEVIDFIRNNQPEPLESPLAVEEIEEGAEYTSVEFDDLEIK